MRALRSVALAALAFSSVSPRAARAQQTLAAPAASHALLSDSALLAIIQQRVAAPRAHARGYIVMCEWCSDLSARPIVRTTHAFRRLPTR